MKHDTTASTHRAHRPPLRVALIGFGAIGAELYRVLNGCAKEIEVTGALVNRGPSAVRRRSEGLAIWTSLDELLQSGPDLVVECAGHQAVDAYGEQILRKGHDLLLTSVGALADASRYDRLHLAARESARRLLMATGAIGGIDILSAARRAGLRGVQYRSRKPPRAWLNTIADVSVDLAALTEPTVIFRGNAREAALAYPRNANVAATVALATLGFELTLVELVADPDVSHNVHEIDADGVCGRISIRVEGQPSQTNPKTSEITAYSLANQILTEKNIFSRI